MDIKYCDKCRSAEGVLNYTVEYKPYGADVKGHNVDLCQSCLNMVSEMCNVAYAGIVTGFLKNG